MKTIDQKAIFSKASDLASKYFDITEQDDLFSPEYEEFFDEEVDDTNYQDKTASTPQLILLATDEEYSPTTKNEDEELAPSNHTVSTLSLEPEPEPEPELDPESELELELELESGPELFADELDEFIELDVDPEDDESDYFDEEYVDPIEDQELSPTVSGLNSGFITQYERAAQIASEFRAQHGWSKDSHDVLTHLFDTKGWGRIRSTLSLLIHHEEMKESEFLIARQIRQYWKSNTHFWICIPRANSTLQESRINYGTLAWRWCLQAVRSFSQAQASAVEITNAMSEGYSEWYESDELSNSFPAFQHYICYLIDTSNLEKRLSFYSGLCDDYYKLDGFWGDSGCNDPLGHTETTMLKELGILN